MQQRSKQTAIVLTRFLSWSLGTVGCLPSLLLLTTPGSAQITPDTSLESESSVVTPDVTVQESPATLIEGGALRGTNLFHSFTDFSVSSGQSVYFANPIGIENILSRVTGSNISSIDGLLGVDGAANLFLLNPNGVIFGPNAQLDISGSFVASTANRFTFADGSEFTATPTGNELLTVSVPLGLQLSHQPQGNITSMGMLATGQDLTLIGNDLAIASHLLAGDNLTLQAQETLTLRDTVTTSSIIGAGATLTLQGEQLVDIWALNHPESGLFSGADLVLRSDHPIIGDGHFFAGGNLRVETLNGGIADLISPNDPILLANGNVELGNYTGASLHILAGGSVTLGVTRVNSPGGDDSSIHPDNTTSFNGSLTYADLATFEVTDYDIITNPDGTLSQVPVQKTITVNGNDKATLDVRAGVDWDALGGLPSTPIVEGTVNPIFPGGDLGSDITINGLVRLFEPSGGGQVVLTNQYQPNPNLAAGTIDIGNVNANINVTNADGGSISLYSRGDVTVNGSLNSFSSVALENAGPGGDITIAAESGAVTISGGRVNAFSQSDDANAAAGGSISISASGDITTNELFSFAEATGSGNAAAGGEISLFSESGNITIGPEDKPFQGRVQSFSNVEAGQASSGGEVLLLSQAGIITTHGTFNSSSRSTSGIAGIGGNITFAALGDVTTNGGLGSFSASTTGTTGDGGSISLFSESGNLFVNQILLASSDSESGTAGSGGDIALSAPTGSVIGNPEADDTTVSDSGNTRLLTFSIVQSEGQLSGTGGAVTITARDDITDFEVSTLSSTEQSGRVQIEGNSDLLLDNTNLTTSANFDFFLLGIGEFKLNALNTGESGDVVITSAGDLTFNNVNIASDTNLDADAGAITIASPGVVRLIDSAINSNTSGTGAAGNITVTADSGLIIEGAGSGIFASTAPQVAGRGGSIALNTSQLTFADGGAIAASTAGSGDGGSILFNPQADALTITGNGEISVATSGTGNAGGFTINAPDITIDQARLSASTSGEGTGGSLELNASQLTFANGGAIAASTSGDGSGGSLILNAPETLAIQGDGAINVGSQTGSSGQSGDLTINAPRVEIDQTQLLASSAGTGRGGDIELNTATLSFGNGAQIAASTFGSGDGGSIFFNPQGDALTIVGDGEISVATSGEGDAGGFTIDVPNIAVDEARLSASTSSSGSGGSIVLQTSQLRVTNNGAISASTSGTGAGGNLTLSNDSRLTLQGDGQLTVGAEEATSGRAGTLQIIAPTLTLEGVELSANSNSENGGGDIEIVVDSNILMSDGSFINAASNNPNAGDGGNITITLAEGFLIGTPAANNDIIANAIGGNGGNISITALDILGFIEQDESDTMLLRSNQSNDISASSELGFNGLIVLNTLDIDPARGLTELPTDFTDRSNQIVASCGSNTEALSEFVITGRGGLPVSPDDLGVADSILIPWTTPDADTPTTTVAPPSPSPAAPPVEAQGMVIGANGTVHLFTEVETAHASLPHAGLCAAKVHP